MEARMSVADIAKTFTEALRTGNSAAAEALWSDDIVSIENMDGPMKEMRGREAVHGKGVWWFANHEVHSFETVGPFVNGDAFALVFKVDMTVKESGQRMQMEEVGLYTVRGGKIAEERFFT
jgi:ketosteroid isomerase-like protein